jgi:hypothetical protein
VTEIEVTNECKQELLGSLINPSERAWKMPKPIPFMGESNLHHEYLIAPFEYMEVIGHLLRSLIVFLNPDQHPAGTGA